MAVKHWFFLPYFWIIIIDSCLRMSVCRYAVLNVPSLLLFSLWNEQTLGVLPDHKIPCFMPLVSLQFFSCESSGQHQTSTVTIFHSINQFILGKLLTYFKVLLLSQHEFVSLGTKTGQQHFVLLLWGRKLSSQSKLSPQAGTLQDD